MFISDNVNTIDDEGQTSFEFEGAFISIVGNGVKVIKGEKSMMHDLAYFRARPTAFMRMVKGSFL